MRPTVTVIIPVFNAELLVEEVLQSLCCQTYSPEKTEIIFVDNGSTDNSNNIIRKYAVKLLATDGDRNPYLARNRALEIAKGEIIAFADANKIPAKNWIESGVAALTEHAADLAAGDIRFRLDENSAPAEIYDAITFNNNKLLAERENASVTGNLFVRKELFKILGRFPANRRSGMDVWWTHRAVAHGFSLIFAEQAVVHCIPRSFTNVLKKSYRVGISHPFNMQSSGQPLISIFITSLKTFAPPKILKLKGQLEQQHIQVSFFTVWMIAWLSKIWMGAGRLRGFFQLNFKAGNNTS